MNRRDFLKTAGAATVASSALLTACTSRNHTTTATPAASCEPPTSGMTLRHNPNTGDDVSILGYGMMRLPVLPKAVETDPDVIDQEMVNRQVTYALEHGVNYFDTSPVYCQGKSEEATGIALAQHPRGSYYIATKLSNFDSHLWPFRASQQMFENSLRYLQTDYIDYLLLHAIGGGRRDLQGNQLDAFQTFNARYMDNGLLDWLVEQKAAGRIRNLGFSFHGDVALFDELLRWHDKGRYHWDFVQIELNYLEWHVDHETQYKGIDAKYLYDELHRRGIPAVIMEPLQGGRLAKVPEADVAKMKQRRPDATIASWAFRFAGTPEGILTVLSGMTYMEHLQDNIRTYAPLEPISEEEDRFLSEVAGDIRALKSVPCTGCNYCMPCPYGINIPAIFAHYNKVVREGTLPYNRQSADYQRQRKAYLLGYDEAVPRLRQADHCIGCRECVSHCPQQIDIPGELHRLDVLVENLKRNGLVADKEI